MYFESFSQALSMDGHGGFVWAAYLITSIVIVLLLQAPRRRQKKILRQLAGELKRSRGGPISSEEGT